MSIRTQNTARQQR